MKTKHQSSKDVSENRKPEDRMKTEASVLLLMHDLHNMINSFRTKETDVTAAVKSKLRCRTKKTLTVSVGAATKGSQNKGSVVEFSMVTMFSEDESNKVERKKQHRGRR